MAWTNPADAINGAIIQASLWNTSGRDNLNYLKGKAGDVDIEDHIRLPNNKFYKVRNNAGAEKFVLGMGSDNGMYIGDDGAAYTLITGQGLNNLYYDPSDGGGNGVIWHSRNDGPGSTLDADTIDGVQEAALAKLASANFTTLQRGGQSVATLDSANFTALQQGGNTVITTATLPPILLPASGTYTGNGATSAIQIATGFVPKLVIITGGTSNANLANLHIHSASGCLYQDNAGNIAWDTTSGRLHGSDGFTVANGSARANASGVVYTYVAFR